MRFDRSVYFAGLGVYDVNSVTAPYGWLNEPGFGVVKLNDRLFTRGTGQINCVDLQLIVTQEA